MMDSGRSTRGHRVPVIGTDSLWHDEVANSINAPQSILGLLSERSTLQVKQAKIARTKSMFAGDDKDALR